MTKTIFTKFVPTSQNGPTLNLALIGQAVYEKKMFENNGHIHVYSPGAGADNPLASIFFKKNIKSSVNLVICCKFYPLNDFVTVLSI